MRHYILLSLSLAWLGAMVQVQARAGEFTSPKGFSLNCPEKWRPATKEELDMIAEMTKKTAANAPVPAAMIFGPVSEAFAPNVTIIVVPATTPLNDESEADIIKGFNDSFTAAGQTPPAVKKARITIDGKPALALAHESTQQGSRKQVRYWKIFLPGKKQTYVITCLSLKSQWAEAWPGFKETVKSMKIDLEQP